MKKKVMIVALSLMLFGGAFGVLADQQGKVFNVDLGAFKGVYTSDYYDKSYETDQTYWNNKTSSTHDGTVHDVSVNLQKSNGNETGYKNVGTNDTYRFSSANYKEKGNYRIKLRNSVTSIYKYFSSGIWYYSV
ncbi:MAG: hypothetical protein OSJ65_05665 [Bacilli bacterium]|nr:hypothetical protein [Bacilli bacterium]